MTATAPRAAPAGEDASGERTPPAERRSPLFVDAWLDFNATRFGLRPLRVRAPDDRAADLEAVLYLDRRGHCRLPPLNPYLPVAFGPSAGRRPLHHRRQRLRAVAPLVEEMRRRGVGDNLIFSPAVDDPRPWQWAGYRTAIGSTIVNRLPLDHALVDAEALRMARKARERGYTTTARGTPDAVKACLEGTAAAKGFDYELGAGDIGRLVHAMGTDVARTYLARAADGSPASAMLVLHRPGAMAIVIAGGSVPEHVRLGAAQMLMQDVLVELGRDGAVAVDLAGADIEGVALWKEAWGGRLTQLVRVEPYTVRNALRWGRAWWRQRRADVPPSPRPFGP